MKETLQTIYPEIIKIRHEIHANPELAHNEKATSRLVADTLKNYGYEDVKEIAGTGIVANQR